MWFLYFPNELTVTFWVNLDPHATGMEAIGVVPHEVSAADPPHPMARLHIQQRSSASHWSVGSLNDVSDCSVMLPGLLTMYQQIGSSGPAAKHKTVPGHDWRRARGRPPTTWTQQICQDTGVTVTDALRLTEDRSFWWQIAMAGSYGCNNISISKINLVSPFYVSQVLFRFYCISVLTRSQAVARIADRTAKNSMVTPSFRGNFCAPACHSPYEAVYQIWSL